MKHFPSPPQQTDEVEYTEVLRVPTMSIGTYTLPTGAIDPQSPHTEDEVYVILAGRGVLRTESGDAPAVPGVALFVPAGEHHSFVDITEPLSMYVVFSPAEGANTKAATP
ncbi:cupin domain-containing protein [Microbacterium sp. J1-1]|uniref:cupin domain-containing protein n=1 Tax=Microbacterium sp. J1-1 TaxID=2992441 RepID=UPI0021152BC8|nr:cupin domain-containing protein [Microbacterium sp. J1-1]UUE19376.1 cupin domain-containing protein [Microbacterium sp. J1-1]